MKHKIEDAMLCLINEIYKLKESAPEGWEGTVKGMKKHKDITNPFALAHWMKNKKYHSHIAEDETSLVAKQAKQMGLTHAGWGNYKDAKGNSYQSRGGRLVPSTKGDKNAPQFKVRPPKGSELNPKQHAWLNKNGWEVCPKCDNVHATAFKQSHGKLCRGNKSASTKSTPWVPSENEGTGTDFGRRVSHLQQTEPTQKFPADVTDWSPEDQAKTDKARADRLNRNKKPKYTTAVVKESEGDEVKDVKAQRTPKAPWEKHYRSTDPEDSPPKSGGERQSDHTADTPLLPHDSALDEAPGDKKITVVQDFPPPNQTGTITTTVKDPPVSPVSKSIKKPTSKDPYQ